MSEDRKTEILGFIRSLNEANQSVDMSTDLIETGALDSLSVLELVGFLTDKFKVTIQAADVTPANLRSVLTLSALVEARLQ